MSDHWHKQYHGDCLTSYAGLPVDLRGVAYTLLDLIYDRGGPLAESDSMLAARMCCSLRMWSSYKRRLIEAGKFSLTREGHLTNSRAENELKKRQKLSEFGAKGGRKKAENAKIRKSFKDGDLATLDEHQLAPGLALDARDREEPKGSSSEAKASALDAPADQAPPVASGGDAWTLAAQAINPGDPKKGRKVVGLINSDEVVERLGPGAKAAATFRKAVLALLQTGLTGDPAIEYLRKTARNAAAEAGGGSEPTKQPEAARLFRIVEEGGVRYRVDKVTGERVEIGRVAA